MEIFRRKSDRRQTIRILISIDVDANQAGTLEPVDGWNGTPDDEGEPPIPGVLALGQWIAGSMAGEALSQISPKMIPEISGIRVEVEEPFETEEI